MATLTLRFALAVSIMHMERALYGYEGCIMATLLELLLEE